MQEADALAHRLSEEAGVEIQLRYLKSGFVFQVAREDDSPNLLGGKLGNRVRRIHGACADRRQAVKAKHVQYNTIVLAKINMRVKASLEEIFMLSDKCARSCPGRC